MITLSLAEKHGSQQVERSVSARYPGGLFLSAERAGRRRLSRQSCFAGEQGNILPALYCTAVNALIGSRVRTKYKITKRGFAWKSAGGAEDVGSSPRRTAGFGAKYMNEQP